MAQTITSESWSEPHPGMRLLTGRTSGPTTRFWALEVDLCGSHVHVDATAPASSRRTPASWGGAVGAQAAINGDFYRTDRTTPTVYGLAVGDGRRWPSGQTAEGFAGDWYANRYGWIAFGDGWVEYAHSGAVKRAGAVRTGFRPGSFGPEIPDGTVALVSGFPELVIDGARVRCSSPTASDCFPDRTDMRGRHPRSAMGLSADRRTLYLVAVDGRSSVSSGMYGAELAKLMEDLGAHVAFNLDGGGSTQMWVDGRGTVNAPSGGARSVANHWGVFASSAMPAAPGSCQRFDGCFLDDDAEHCDVLETILAPSGEGRARTTDLNGDGRADLCARANAGLRCFLSGDDGFTAAAGFDLEAMSDRSGFTDPANYATIRMGDIDADGLADVCTRGDAGIRCWRSTGAGFAADVVVGPGLSDEGGWAATQYYPSIQLADVTGDGRDDVCARGFAGVHCWPSLGDAFGERIDGPAWGSESGWSDPDNYGTLRFADLDGDGALDVCARANAGLRCARSTGTGFDAPFAGPDFDGAAGFARVSGWSTIRLADIDGDGRADVCGRGSSGLRCHLFDGSAFGAAIEVAALSDETGWADHGNYATLRTGDVTGDGADDLCIRRNAGVRCYAYEGGAFATLAGPACDDPTWNDPAYYGTFRVADVTGDGLADLCARGPGGVECHRATGTGFEPHTPAALLSDASGWAPPEHWSTVMVAGGCRIAPETCDGRDEDCDGRIDEGVCADDAGPAMDAGGVGGDAGARDAGHERDAAARFDAGPREAVSGGCACELGAGPSAGGLPLVFALIALRRRR